MDIPMQNDFSDIIMNNLLDGVLIVNKEGKIIYANKAAEVLFLRQTSELVGQDFGFPLLPLEVQEIELIRKGRLLTVQMLASQIRWDDEPAHLLSLRDITQLKKVSRQLEDQKTILEKTNKELEQYASIASHDLKEPVRKIIIFSDMLLNGNSFQSVEEIKTLLVKISKSAERMKSLLNGIAAYSNFAGATMHYELVNLKEVVREVLADLEMLIAEKNAQVKVDDLPTIEAIRIQMHQLFLNIISNALKYAKKEEAPAIFVKHTDLGSIIEIIITDNGIGFDNRLANKIFEPLQRLRPKEYEGSGVGLAICKKIIDEHGGSISAKSQPGKGSEFIFTLQRKRRDELAM
jgi:light-regulated signal transduction histidine kinase (bacteriophytochrome)